MCFCVQKGNTQFINGLASCVLFDIGNETTKPRNYETTKHGNFKYNVDSYFPTFVLSYIRPVGV